ncbi:MAG: T9SS type A sorting domain-containing protein [Ignavibacteria bacterium]|nr:T9SS type A sorting domain-containing protein [Ignavibacteria bacterium]
MKQIFTLLLCTFLISLGVMHSQTPKDYAVMLKITTQKSPAPSIKISWPLDKFAQHYQVYRRTAQSQIWGQPIVDLDSGAVEFADTEIEIGKEYEYQVLQKKVINDTISYIAVGYAMSGIEVTPAVWRGKVLLLVDSAIATPLSTEITRLMDDLKTEGFSVVRRYVSRTEAFDGNAVKTVKAVIMQEYNKDKANLKSVFILGRIAVPYSGNLYPDGHPDHQGAWPADCYYGDVDGVWNDKSVNITVASRAENKNIPGDGKFDLTSFDENLSPITIELQIGRVDFYNMPAFMDSSKHATLLASELDLYRRYLDKNHAYRTGRISPKTLGVIADNFGSYGGDMFSNSAWRNFSALLGNENVKAGNYFDLVKDTNALWAYGCGGGSYTSCGGVGTTTDFVTKPVNAVFTMLFGSYFGDWDSKNNIMRSVLASNGAALTCSWVGRPHSYYQHMGIGKTIGYSTVLSQNNSYTNVTANYMYGIDFSVQYPDGLYRYSYGTRFIHQSLLGDPTLRMNMEFGALPKPDKIVQVKPAGGGGPISLEWNYSDQANEKKVDGYFVYRDDALVKTFKLLNPTILKQTSYEDTNVISGNTYTYFIRAATLRQSATGSFYDVSDSISIQAMPPVGVEEMPSLVSSLECTPMPAVHYTDIQFTNERAGELLLEITDLTGATVATLGQGNYAEGNHTIRWNVMNSTGNRVSAGVYLLTISRDKQTQTMKIVVAN